MICAVFSSVVRWMMLNDALGVILFRYLSSPCVTLPSAPNIIGVVCIFSKFQHFLSSISKS